LNRKSIALKKYLSEQNKLKQRKKIIWDFYSFSPQSTTRYSVHEFRKGLVKEHFMKCENQTENKYV